MSVFYHRTTASDARAILDSGFRGKRGFYGLDIEVEGVWLSDRPLGANEGVYGDTLLAVTLDADEIINYEVIEDGQDLGRNYRMACAGRGPGSLRDGVHRRGRP